MKSNTQLLRLKEALLRVQCGKTTFYQSIKLGLLPAPVRLGKRTSVWRESELDAAISKLPRSAMFQELTSRDATDLR